MDRQPFDQLTDAEVRAAAGIAAGADGPGFDAATQARVYADGLLRARGRFAHYRALYAAFVGAGAAYMVENLDDEGDGRAVPAKLLFADGPPGAAVEENPFAVVWTERRLLEALAEERAVQDFFAELLDELAPALG